MSVERKEKLKTIWKNVFQQNNTTSAVHLTFWRENKLSVKFLPNFEQKTAQKHEGEWRSLEVLITQGSRWRYDVRACVVCRMCSRSIVCPIWIIVFPLCMRSQSQGLLCVDKLPVLTSCCDIFMFFRFKFWSYLKCTKFWVVQRLVRIYNSLLGCSRKSSPNFIMLTQTLFFNV